jgi:hypothetical protein
MSIRTRLTALLATIVVALAIGGQVASASAHTIPGQGWSPGPILPPTPQCPLWYGVVDIPVGCVPWAAYLEGTFGIHSWLP